MYTKTPHPGKFEGNTSQWAAEVVYDCVGNGWCDEQEGSVIENGLWVGLVKGKRYGFIITEDSQGFVNVDAYSLDEARQKYDEIAAEIRGNYEDNEE